MRVFNIIKSSVACAALLTACGGGEDFGPLKERSGEVNAAQAALLVAEFDKAIATFKIDGPANPPAVNGVTYGLTNESDPFDACRKDEPSVLVDEDDDKIPKSKQSTFDCNIDDGVAIRKQKGKMTITDLDDTKQFSAGGYEYTYDLEGDSNYKAGGFYEFRYKGYLRYELKGDGYLFDSNYAYDLTGDSPSDGKYSAHYQSTWKHEVKPDDATDPGKAGSVVFSGFFYSKATSDDPTFVPHNATVEMKSDGVKYDRSCSSFYKEGSITLLDVKGNTIRYDYACNTVTKTYNEQSL